MKHLILSRKGFDSSAGGMPNPILPDGRLLMLPIPDKRSPITYADLKFDGRSLSDYIQELSRNTFPRRKPESFATLGCHPDPDVRPEALPRLLNWRPTFGQAGASQSHLNAQGVDIGDLFLFFGWFRQTEWQKGQLIFQKSAPDIHLLWGWLQIGEIYHSSQIQLTDAPWLAQHPHFHGTWPKNNTLYLAADYCNIKNIATVLPSQRDRRKKKQYLPGAGIFSHWHPQLQLTAIGHRRSLWQLPSWFYPNERASTLSYHRDMNRWRLQEDYVLLDSVLRGQEFVLNLEDYPKAIDWVATLFEIGKLSPLSFRAN